MGETGGTGVGLRSPLSRSAHALGAGAARKRSPRRTFAAGNPLVPHRKYTLFLGLWQIGGREVGQGQWKTLWHVSQICGTEPFAFTEKLGYTVGARKRWFLLRESRFDPFPEQAEAVTRPGGNRVTTFGDLSKRGVF